MIFYRANRQYEKDYALLFLLGLGVTSCMKDDVGVPQVAADAPNFLILLTDDQRYDALGIVQHEMNGKGRFPFLRTPNLDILARQGARFRNAFVTSSLCSPSRAGILTGSYSDFHGIRDNDSHFREKSFALALQKSGYETGYFGKWHMGKQSGERPGFSHSFSYVGQGDYENPEIEWNGKPYQMEGWIDNIVTDSVVSYLTKRHHRPFCYFVGFKGIHGPWGAHVPDIEERYQQEKILGVPNLYRRPIYSAAEAKYFTDSTEYRSRYGWKDRAALSYLQNIDQNVGKILNSMDPLMRKNTYIIFLSDNGYYYGEHGLRDKRTAYDESIRIPMFISGPGIPQNTLIDQMVLNIDLAPSILAWSGIKTKTDMDGQNLQAIFDGDPWRSSFIYEYYREEYGVQSDVFAVRTDAYKLIRYPGNPDWTELFDLRSDPYEIHNRIDHPNYSRIKSELSLELDQFITQ